MPTTQVVVIADQLEQSIVPAPSTGRTTRTANVAGVASGFVFHHVRRHGAPSTSTTEAGGRTSCSLVIR